MSRSEAPHEQEPDLDSLGARAAVFRAAAVKRYTSPEDLDDLMIVTHSGSWMMLGALAFLVATAAAWAFWGRLDLTAVGEGELIRSAPVSAGLPGELQAGELQTDELQAVLYVSPAEAFRVRPGMKVHLQPAGFPVAQFGYLQGLIQSVEMVVRPSGEGNGQRPIVRVTVDLGSSAQNKLSWTTERPAQSLLSAGLPVAGQIYVGSERPIHQILPWLRRVQG